MSEKKVIFSGQSLEDGAAHVASLENLFQAHAEWPSGENVPDVSNHRRGGVGGCWSEQRRKREIWALPTSWDY